MSNKEMKMLKPLFRAWDKYLIKAFLSSSSIVTEKDKGFTQVIQKKQNDRFVRQTFTYWVQMTRKSQDAMRLYTDRLLPK